MTGLPIVSESVRGYMAALRRPWTIRTPTHLLIDARGEIVGMLQRRGQQYSAVQMLQLGNGKPRHVFGSLDGDLMRLDPGAFYYLRGLDDKEHESGGYSGAASRGELSWIELKREG